MTRHALKRALLAALAFAVGSLVRAQVRISGTVTDAQTGESVIAAGVVCPEAPSKGTVTDLDGNFTISVGNDAATLLFTCLGYEDLTLKISTLKDLGAVKVTMFPQVLDNELGEAVVTGYAQTTTKRVTGSVAVLKSDIFEAKPVVSVDALMAGEVAGVSVKATSGQPGTQSKIRIRGTNNLSGNSDPLWVVDGVPIQNESNLSSDQIATGGLDNIFVSGVGSINPNDIESVTILKDAAAAAIYGSKAANGVIVITTKKGEQGRLKIGYSNNFTWSFRPERSVNLMNSAEKLDWERELWEEFSAERYNKSLTDNTIIYPVIGITGQVLSGAGDFASLTKEEREDYLKSLRSESTDWYSLLFRNAFSNNHHLSLSGGSDKSTYYISGGFNDNNGMLRRNNYTRYNVTANLTLRPVERVKLDFGLDASRQRSITPDSSVNAFTYAYFANPYEKAYNPDGSYGSDHTWFSLGYYNGRGVEEVLPKAGFSILRELDLNTTVTTNSSASLRGGIDIAITRALHFNGLASWSLSENDTDKTVDASTYTAFKDRLGNDDKSQTKLYGNITQNRTARRSYILRGHFNWNRTFEGSLKHNINVIAGSEIRGSKSNTLYAKRYNYDPVTGTSSMPEISGPVDEWEKQVERLSGEYFSESRYASFYLSGDYYLGNTIVANASFRTDGSSNFGVNSQFHPTWSVGAGWHFADEPFMDRAEWLSHGTLRAAFGYTGNINSYARHLLVMEYLHQQYRYYGGESYHLGTIPSAPNPSLGWERTSDLKAGIDLGFLKEAITFSAEAYLRKSSDVVTSAQVQSTTGFTSVYFNSADILNSGFEATLTWNGRFGKDFRMRASANFAYNYNKVTRYTPASGSTITAKDRYVEGYPVGAIFAGRAGGVDSASGLYAFHLRSDASIATAQDLNNPDNYRYYLGTTVAPYTGGINLSVSWKQLRLSVSGVYSLGAKVYDKIVSPASYLNARHTGVSTEEVQSQFSDLYSNHLNVTRDRTSRWTADNTAGVLYPRIYDRFNAIYNFAFTNPMDYNIIDAIYLKDVSYLRIKSIILSYSLPKSVLRKIRVESLSFNLSADNFFTFTAYDGMDPEVPGATYPTTRSVSLGASISF